jgi:hypothetical protein
MEFRYGVLDFCRHAGSYVGARTKQPAHMKEKKRTPSRLGFVTFVNQPIDLLRGNVRGHPQETLCRVRSPILLVSFEYEQRAHRLVEALVGTKGMQSFCSSAGWKSTTLKAFFGSKSPWIS